ncbi:hypothetical protein ACFYNO_10300 [Kitasatospora sp. NPDC006697]|uniref:hypothetical protein n=1 Tax=Kitasatospora sp. NPDC006697 TaxID=3364020 RepID=UPI0036B723DE
MQGSDWTHEEERDGARLAGAFQRSVGGVEPELTALIAGAAAQGRSLRRRRRGLALGAVAGAVALVAGAAALVGGGGPDRVGAAGSGSSPLGPPASPLPVLNGRLAATGQDLLLAAVRRMPQGVEMGEGSGQTTVFTVAGKPTPQLHVRASSTGPVDGKGTQFLEINLDTDITHYLAQLSGSDPLVAEATQACSDIKAKNSGGTVDCSTSDGPDGGSYQIVRRTGQMEISTNVIYKRADGVVVSAFEDRENQMPGSGAMAPPSLDADLLTSIVTSAEMQAWVTPGFRAAAQSVVSPYLDLDGPQCVMGPGGGLTIMPSARPTSAPATVLPPIPADTPTAGWVASGSAGAGPTPSAKSCPPPNTGLTIETEPVWPAG